MAAILLTTDSNSTESTTSRLEALDWSFDCTFNCPFDWTIGCTIDWTIGWTFDRPPNCPLQPDPQRSIHSAQANQKQPFKMQRIFSNFITPPPQTNGNANDMPWLFVTGARGLATFAGISMQLLLKFCSGLVRCKVLDQMNWTKWTGSEPDLNSSWSSWSPKFGLYRLSIRDDQTNASNHWTLSN